jgi:hypothetical protein
LIVACFLSINDLKRIKMKNLSLKMPVKVPAIKNIEPYLLTVIVCLLWYTAPVLFELPAGNSKEIATSIGLMLLLALISFLLVLGLCWWLLHRFWTVIGLPGLGCIVLEFKSLQLWQQLSFWLASFALLLLAATGALMAVL